jgi:adenylate cyclase
MPSEIVRRYNLRTSLPANVVGALVTFAYFRFIDYGVIEAEGLPTAGEIVYFLAFFSLLVVVGVRLASRWNRPLEGPVPPPGVAGDLGRRRALQLPYVIATTTLTGWTMAGGIWGIGWPLIIGRFTPEHAARMVFGITVISGLTATALVFLAVEHGWRRVLPKFFPDGGLTRVPGAPRLPVRARLLIVMLLAAVLPVAVVGMAAHRGAAAALAAGPDAGEVIEKMLLVVGFLVLVTTVTSIGLALFVSSSVAEPLARLRGAMAEVERGNLEARCTEVSNDEIGELTEGFNRMLRGLRERDFLKETFGKYVSQEIRDEILAGRIALEGQVREATILFADLRDFTPWVEATDPREVVRDLNAYFTEMNVAIRAHGGLVLQFIGDEIEAVFGAPVPDPRHAEMAARAALAMRARLAAWNAERERAGKRPLRHGIGVHTGTVLAGNIGSPERLAYSLVGDAVNVASRIQSLTKEAATPVLVSGTTRARLNGGFALTPLPAVRVKGRVAEVEVFALRDA